MLPHFVFANPGVQTILIHCCSVAPTLGGSPQQSFELRGSAPMSNPISFYIPFLTEKVPLLYTFYEQI